MKVLVVGNSVLDYYQDIVPVILLYDGDEGTSGWINVDDPIRVFKTWFERREPFDNYDKLLVLQDMPASPSLNYVLDKFKEHKQEIEYLL